jgi:hypothetical protein
MKNKYLLVAILGAAAYFAYKQLKKTQTVENILTDSTIPSSLDVSTIAGYR